MLTPSFNEEYWASQPLADFIVLCAKYKMNEVDAIGLHRKFRKEWGVQETESDKVTEKLQLTDDTERNAPDPTGSPSENNGRSEGNDIGEQGLSNGAGDRPTIQSGD